MIKKRGFEKIYQAIRLELMDPKFKKIASILFDNHSTKKEYENFARNLGTCISKVGSQSEASNAIKVRNAYFLFDQLHEIGNELIPKEIKHIKILNDFEPVNAVRFYRENIHKNIIEGLDERAKQNIITEGLHEFLRSDNYLSPFTSYPVNGTLELILSQPFQRIYDDIYLLDGESFGLMSIRAAAIYNFFPDILFELVRNDPPDLKELETITKQMVFHWNVASTRFDIICICLDELYKNGKHVGNYHLGINGLSYYITDLDSNAQLLPIEASRSILLQGLIPLIVKDAGRDWDELEWMENPFTELRPCMTFSGSGFIPIEAILDKLESKLAD